MFSVIFEILLDHFQVLLILSVSRVFLPSFRALDKLGFCEFYIQNCIQEFSPYFLVGYCIN